MENTEEKIEDKKESIWNKNFTILTVGSIVSLAGNSLTGFATSLYVYDQTSSTFLFALFSVLALLPGIVLPALSGPLLDKFSRRKVIYTLDFISCSIYAVYTGVTFAGLMNYWVMAVGNLVLGSIGAVYNVAYESFYPMVVEKKNYSKAYAVTSTIQTIVPYLMPVGWFIYRKIGMAPLFAINMVCYLVAALFELRIRVEESYVKAEGEVFGLRQYGRTFKEGLQYLGQEKGLLAIVLYFTLVNFSGSALDVNMLPYFTDHITNGEVLVQLLWACYGLGRITGGRLHYKHKLPVDRKYAIALTVYVVTGLIDGTLLFIPVVGMFIVYFISGVLGMTSYNIRISSTQSYVPDDRKGRFNGTFGMLCSLGSILGRMLAGALGEFMDVRFVVLLFMSTQIVLIPLIFIPHGKKVKEIYNMDI